MRVVVTRAAGEDIEAADAWWREHRVDAPTALALEVADALEWLSVVGPSLSVFRRLRGGIEVRRTHLPRIHKHLYVVVQPDRIVVLALWGAVRGILPALRERLATP